MSFLCRRLYRGLSGPLPLTAHLKTSLDTRSKDRLVLLLRRSLQKRAPPALVRCSRAKEETRRPRQAAQVRSPPSLDLIRNRPRIRFGNPARRRSAGPGVTWGMQPDASTPSRQGSGTKSDKTGKTVPREAIPEDLREREGVDDGLTEGALPPTSGTPNTTGMRENGRRNVDKGMHS